MREDPETGKCTEKKDYGLLAFNRLYRAPSWQELNPGRPERPTSRLSFSVDPNTDGLKVHLS